MGGHMTRNIVRQIHLWLGIALCIPLLLLGLTGSVLVFEDELRAAFGPAPHVAGSGPAHSADEIIAAARTAAPSGYVPQSYMAPAEPGALAVVRLTLGQRGPGPSEQLRVEVDPATLQAFPDQGADLLRQIFFLHSTLLMKNREGRQLIGWLGVVMLVMGVTGLVNWWPRGHQWRSAFTVTRRGWGFQVNREVHGAVGIWGLAVFIVVSFAGVALAFPESVRAIVNPILPARDLRAAAASIKVEPVKGQQPLATEDAIGLARERVPGARLRLAFLPSRPDQPVRLGMVPEGGDSHAPLVSVFVDPWARRVVSVFDPREFSAGETMLAWQHALHAGQALGPLWKLLVFLCGFLPLTFVVTGLAMWWLKRSRRRGRAADQDAVLENAYTARRAGE
jgi:uncharacterized iron-regulated membrane protein